MAVFPSCVMGSPIYSRQVESFHFLVAAAFCRGAVRNVDTNMARAYPARFRKEYLSWAGPIVVSAFGGK